MNPGQSNLIIVIIYFYEFLKSLLLSNALSNVLFLLIQKIIVMLLHYIQSTVHTSNNF